MHPRTIVPAALLDLCDRQAGLFTTAQAADLGTSETALRRNREGRWTKVGRGVWRLLDWSLPSDPVEAALVRARQRGMIVQLSHPSAIACDDLAAELLGADGWWSGDACRHVAAVGQHRRPGWRARPSGPADLVVLDGLLVTSPWRTLYDLCDAHSAQAIELVLESFLRTARIALSDDDARKAPPALRMLLEARGDLPPTESMAETLFVQLARLVPGLRPPDRQVEVFDGAGRCVGRVDFVWPELGLCIEIDGAYHDMQMVKDDARDAAVVAATGWRIVTFRWAHLTVTPHATVRRLRSLVGC